MLKRRLSCGQRKDDILEVIMIQTLAVLGTQVAQYIIGGFMIAFALALIVLVLMQSGKEKGLSGTLTGSADTFFSKNGGKSSDKLLSRLTIVASIIMVALTVAMTVLVTIG